MVTVLPLSYVTEGDFWPGTPLGWMGRQFRLYTRASAIVVTLIVLALRSRLPAHWPASWRSTGTALLAVAGYALLVALIALVTVAALVMVGGPNPGFFSRIDSMIGQ